MWAGKEIPSSTRRSSNEQEEPWKSPEAGGEMHKGKQHTWGVPSSSTGAIERDSFKSLCLFQCLSLFAATLPLFCNHIYKSSGALQWIRDSPSLPTHSNLCKQKEAGAQSSLKNRAPKVGKKLSKYLNNTKQELWRAYTSPLMSSNSFLTFPTSPHVTLSSYPSNSSLPSRSCSHYTSQTKQPVPRAMSHKMVTREQWVRASQGAVSELTGRKDLKNSL